VVGINAKNESQLREGTKGHDLVKNVTPKIKKSKAKAAITNRLGRELSDKGGGRRLNSGGASRGWRHRFEDSRVLKGKARGVLGIKKHSVEKRTIQPLMPR